MMTLKSWRLPFPSSPFPESWQCVVLFNLSKSQNHTCAQFWHCLGQPKKSVWALCCHLRITTWTNFEDQWLVTHFHVSVGLVISRLDMLLLSTTQWTQPIQRARVTREYIKIRGIGNSRQRNQSLAKKLPDLLLAQKCHKRLKSW